MIHCDVNEFSNIAKARHVKCLSQVASAGSTGSCQSRSVISSIAQKEQLSMPSAVEWSDSGGVQENVVNLPFSGGQGRCLSRYYIGLYIYTYMLLCHWYFAICLETLSA